VIYLKQPRRPEALMASLAAPIKGWNARDPIGAMNPLEARDLQNWFPTPSDVMLRKGYSDHVTVVQGGAVESLMAYKAQDGTERLYAAAGQYIDNVTAATATASHALSGMSNARWQHTNFSNSSAVSYLLMVNGADGYKAFDGSSWSNPSITGVTASNLVHITQHKRRLWFVKEDSLRAYYLENVDSIGGTANYIDLSGFARKGGKLNAIDTWTLDAGEGMDDYWAAVTSEGEVIVYAGTDPTSSNTWTMVGRWELGKPLGRRCFRKFAGDLLYLAEDGVWPMSGALISERVRPRVALTDNIVSEMNAAAQSHRSSFGWQLMYWPRGTMVLVNIPVSAGQTQYVMNSISGAWCRFTGVEANCWEIFEGNLFFGGNGFVSMMWDGFDDDGRDIEGNAEQAFHNFKRPQAKQFTMMRPFFQSNGTPAVAVGLQMDFDDSDPTSTLTFTSTTYAVWDSALWDTGVWGGGLSVLRNWQTISGIGEYAGAVVKAKTNGVEVRWTATEYLYKPAVGLPT
jgi:hypothetical protein